MGEPFVCDLVARELVFHRNRTPYSRPSMGTISRATHFHRCLHCARLLDWKNKQLIVKCFANVLCVMRINVDAQYAQEFYKNMATIMTMRN